MAVVSEIYDRNLFIIFHNQFSAACRKMQKRERTRKTSKLFTLRTMFFRISTIQFWAVLRCHCHSVAVVATFQTTTECKEKSLEWKTKWVVPLCCEIMTLQLRLHEEKLLFSPQQLGLVSVRGSNDDWVRIMTKSVRGSVSLEWRNRRDFLRHKRTVSSCCCAAVSNDDVAQA